MFRFERLEIWHKAIDFAKLIYEQTAKFPDQERFGLVSQTRRAAVSISANIAEGSSRGSDKEFSRYIEIAYGSLCETISHLKIAEMQGFMSKESLRQSYENAEDLARRLTSFRNSLGQWKSVAEDKIP